MGTLHDMQLEATRWCLETFGRPSLASNRERALRMLEECIEAGQSVGLTMADIAILTRQVYDKPTGIVQKEIGDAIFTTLLLAASTDVDAETATRWVIQDAWNRQAYIRTRHKLKYRDESTDVKE